MKLELTAEANASRKFLRSPGSASRNALNHEIRVMLGLSVKKRLPGRGKGLQRVGGIKVIILSLSEAKAAGQFHRIVAECPDCGKWMSVGRLHQHSIIHAREFMKRQLAEAKAAALHDVWLRGGA